MNKHEYSIDDQLKKYLTEKHPPSIGAVLKKHIFDDLETITCLAHRLSIGRPALSNLINGNSALSNLMALRIERLFNVSGEQLLSYQSVRDFKIFKELIEGVSRGENKDH